MSREPSKKILLLGCSTKAGTYVTKQFAKLGFDVIIYDWKNLPNQHSKYVSEYIHVASPEADLAQFEAGLLNYLRKNPVQALLPLHDAALEIIRHIREQIPAEINVMGLNADPIYKYAHNKWELLQLAEQNNIAVPKSVYISALTDLPQTFPFTFPCIVKPVSSAVVKNGRLYAFAVTVAKNRAELEDRVREVILNVPVMVQEFIEGYGIGFNFIAKEGRLLNAYIHQRITEHGGVSSYRRILSDTAYGNKETVAAFIEKINWTGVGMLEFKIQNNVPVLMELNGRFFGSIEVSVKSGLNLPKQFLELALYNTLPPRNQPFNLDTKVRNLHDEVFYNLAALAKGRLVFYIKWKLAVLRSLFTKHDFIEDNIFDDPGFVLALYGADLKRIFSKLGKKIKFKLFSLKNKTLQKPETKPLNIAFICMGNICRSPFAAAYAASITNTHAFYSFGSHTQENRYSPLNAVKAAAQFGVSLSEHTSRYLNKKAINTMDLFIVMDKKNYFDLLALGVPAEKIKFLANAVIPDPYGKDYDSFIATYLTIKNNLDSLLK